MSWAGPNQTPLVRPAEPNSAKFPCVHYRGSAAHQGRVSEQKEGALALGFQSAITFGVFGSTPDAINCTRL